MGALHERVGGLGLGDRLEPFDPRPEPGVVLANELLDALPVHRVVGRAAGGIQELFIALKPDRTLTAILGEPSSPGLAKRLDDEGVRLQPGQPAEICLVIDRWIADAAATIERGELLLIDFGFDAAELYRPDRGSMLRAYHRHRVHDEPLVAIGRQDLTAHVDITAVERAAHAAGLMPIGRTSQARFLAALEAGELLVGLQSDPDIDLGRYLEARAALVRMLDPRATGGFAVLGFGREIAPTALRGFGPPAAQPRFDGLPR